MGWAALGFGSVAGVSAALPHAAPTTDLFVSADISDGQSQMARSSLATILILATLTGCAPAITKPVATSLDPVPSYIAPKLPDLIAQEPVDLIAGEPAPHDGVLIHAPDLDRILDALAEAVGVVRILEAQIRADRALLTEREAALLDALGVCRSNQPRSAAAGFAAGVAVGALGAGIACGATR